MKRINVYVKEEDHEWFKKVAKQHNRPIAELLRRAIEDFRMREGQPLGSAYVAIDLDSPDCVPSKEEQTLKGMQERLELLEKFVFDKVISTNDLPNAAFFISQPYLPKYMKK